MENIVKTRLQSVQFGEAQSYKNITIIPLIAPTDGTLQYGTLGQALAHSDVAITEVSSAGSVPELLLVNRSSRPILLIDGEELAGAKQNRVLNTSILIRETSETKIPVSCTEQGRWAYSSAAFCESGHVMAYKTRSRKTSSVHESLQSSGKHFSDQGQVWNDIAELHAKAGSHSPTHAMSDVYKARENDLQKCDEILKPVPNQVGLIAFINGIPVGLDLVSLTGAYARLHPKLVRSYTLEGLLETPPPGETHSQLSTPNSQPAPDSALPTPHSALAQAFLDAIATADEQQFPSIGHGTDFRYRTPDQKPPQAGDISASQLSAFQHFRLCGSALVHQNELIHAAFFRLDDSEQPDRMASYQHRRRHFTE